SCVRSAHSREGYPTRRGSAAPCLHDLTPRFDFPAIWSVSCNPICTGEDDAKWQSLVSGFGYGLRRRARRWELETRGSDGADSGGQLDFAVLSAHRQSGIAEYM